jgi:dolichol-phosphate mannosyltransferase
LQSSQTRKLVSDSKAVDLSVIVPTYNESENILHLLRSVMKNMPSSFVSEIIVVDDNSPDRTGEIVEAYTLKIHGKSPLSETEEMYQEQQKAYPTPSSSTGVIDKDPDTSQCSVKVLHRPEKKGLIPAILEGIGYSRGRYILVMDADFSHSPERIPEMVAELEDPDIDMVVASRYTKGGSIKGWPLRRRLISKGAVKIAKYGLPIQKEVEDPMSGFFALKRHIIEGIKIDSAGYKILLEILVKAKNVRVKEIPYVFTDRRAGKSKLDKGVMLDYIKAVYHLYRYGQRSNKTTGGPKSEEKRKSVLFFSKAGRFYTVGASGLLLNYFVSIFLTNSSIANLGYIQATIVGIIVSNISNFFLNKAWTFEDSDFSIKRTLRQYGLFAAITAGGAIIQLGSLYLFLGSGLQYGISLIIAVALASVSNFLLNKKWTFGEKIWA